MVNTFDRRTLRIGTVTVEGSAAADAIEAATKANLFHQQTSRIGSHEGQIFGQPLS